MSKLITITPLMARELNAALPRGKLTKQKFFKELTFNNQETLLDATRGVIRSLATQELGALGQGFYLAQGQAILAPNGHRTKYGKRNKDNGFDRGFGKWLRLSFHMTQRTAYRKITDYKYAKDNFPDNVVKAAMTRGMTLSSPSIQEVVKKFPPPRTATPEQANGYLDQLMDKMKKRRQRMAKKDKFVPGDPDMLLAMSYRSLSAIVRRLPARSKRRWLESVTGMMLTLVGGSGQRFEPCAIPRRFQPKATPALIKGQEMEDKAKVAS